jgi:nitroimidazol reductase NimA-like FMN-containing flavoprotein (pyridoxamine 5'-phosphate oxidase superfamily)
MVNATKTSPVMIKKKIISFLKVTSALPDKKQGKYRCGMIHRNALVLATSYRDAPRATALEFFHEGLTLYILAGPGGKIANIKRNPRVSAFIYEQPLDHAVVQRSLQLFGRAELVNIRNNLRLFKAKVKKWNLYRVIETLMSSRIKEEGVTGKTAKKMVEEGLYAHNIIKIIPDYIIYKEYPPNFTVRRYEWKE